MSIGILTFLKIPKKLELNIYNKCDKKIRLNKHLKSINLSIVSSYLQFNMAANLQFYKKLPKTSRQNYKKVIKNH